ncbi:WD40 repeat domain-containing serine/threonine protein kinase [Lentzea guizhouensis]|uniref:WD40 repeat domain-containing serine/threonine protein kinase n=1 Tax=Lentzea guizhouensis TaxID=1586287 RepID=UPI00147473BF|nr:serine/threonine-protein kinase [Lentzea guizhouensis]
MTDATGVLVAQRYRLQQVIGTGGMGRVWLGRDELIGREVAIKELVLPTGLDAEQRSLLCRRAMREARLAGQLNHPGIVTVHDVVEFNGTPMIVMEHVRGGSLSDALKAQGALPVEQVAHIGSAMLSALRVAHQAGIVHRDLKPGNVLLSGERVVITDFGIARLTGDVQLTTDGSIVGTPAYMAPEQATGAQVSPATDMWSLGATLYAAVEGRPPFQGQDFMTTLSMLLTQDPPPPTRAGRLTVVLQALLRKNPVERANVDQALAFLAGTPVVPVATGERRGTSRRTVLLAGGAAAVAGLGGAAWWVASSTGKQGEADLPSTPGTNVAVKEGATEQSTSQVPGRPVEITEHLQLKDHEEQVTSIAFSPDGKTLVSGDGDLDREGPAIRLWDVATGKLVVKLHGPTGPGGASANAVAFSPDGRTIAAGGNRLSGSTMLWDVAKREVVGLVDESYSIMKTLAFSPDGKTLAGVTHTGNIQLWDVATRQLKIGIPNGAGSRNIAFSPDGKLLANGGKNGGEVRLSDPATGSTVQTIKDGTGSDVAFSPDNRFVAVPDADGKNAFQIWDVATGQSTAVFPRTEEITLTSVLYSPDGKTVAAWGLGNVIQLWDVASKKIRAVCIGPGSNVECVAFDPGGTRIACGGKDSVIRIWKLDSGR